MIYYIIGSARLRVNTETSSLRSPATILRDAFAGESAKAPQDEVAARLDG
jgi:hypothetical protein